MSIHRPVVFPIVIILFHADNGRDPGFSFLAVLDGHVSAFEERDDISCPVFEGSYASHIILVFKGGYQPLQRSDVRVDRLLPLFEARQSGAMFLQFLADVIDVVLRATAHAQEETAYKQHCPEFTHFLHVFFFYVN